MKYYEVKIKYNKVDETTGKEKTVTLPYIIEGESFGDVEKSFER